MAPGYVNEKVLILVLQLCLYAIKGIEDAMDYTGSTFSVFMIHYNLYTYYIA